MIKPTKKDIALLKSLAEYRILTIDQIAYLNDSGRRAAQKRISSLVNKGMIDLTSKICSGQKGRPEHICSVSSSGASLLLTRNIIPSNTTVNRITIEGISNFDHELLINWFRVQLVHMKRSIEDLTFDYISANSPFLPLRDSGKPLISDQVTLNDRQSIFIPDGVLSLFSAKQKKRILFFLEVDMSTESRTSSNNRTNTISHKIRNYHKYFLTEGYKRYQKKWRCELNGFRLLLLTSTGQRKNSLSRFVQRGKRDDYIWVTDQETLFRSGVSGKIWARGGIVSDPPQAIVGPTYARNLPLPTLK